MSNETSASKESTLSCHAGTGSNQLKRTTVVDLRRMKRNGRRICMLTAYDATFARLLDGLVDILLVGDSLGMVIQGHETTLPVTLDDVIYHTRAVARGARRAHIVADMPFMSYQVSIEQGVENAGRCLQEGNAHAVKLEGHHPELIRRIVDCGVPVMAHLGLTPQSVHAVGGYRVQGRKRSKARQLVEHAKDLEQAGAYSIVLEAVPRELAAEISGELSIPTIGIGAGPDCDGQVLVIYDLLGMDDSFQPRFLKRYESFAGRVRTAVTSYADEVKAGVFPADEHCFVTRRPNGVGAESASADSGETALYSQGGDASVDAKGEA
jgi:3-methyl-2-oxobutanoate hydroxymethyltransferase